MFLLTLKISVNFSLKTNVKYLNLRDKANLYTHLYKFYAQENYIYGEKYTNTLLKHNTLIKIIGQNNLH